MRSYNHHLYIYMYFYNLLFFSRSNFFGDLGWLFISLSVGWIYMYNDDIMLIKVQLNTQYSQYKASIGDTLVSSDRHKAAITSRLHAVAGGMLNTWHDKRHCIVQRES